MNLEGDQPGSGTATMTDRGAGPGRIVGRLARSAGYAALITPVGLATLASLPFAGSEPAARWWQWLTSRVLNQPAETVDHRPTGLRAMVHAVISVLLGLVGWVVIGAIALMFARGALYGLVDPGPYDTSWGGPSLAGAWLAHAAISAVGIVAALLVLRGVVLLLVRLTRWLLGARTRWWLLPLSLILCAATVLFVIAFVRQA